MQGGASSSTLKPRNIPLFSIFGNGRNSFNFISANRVPNDKELFQIQSLWSPLATSIPYFSTWMGP